LPTGVFILHSHNGASQTHSEEKKVTVAAQNVGWFKIYAFIHADMHTRGDWFAKAYLLTDYIFMKYTFL